VSRRSIGVMFAPAAAVRRRDRGRFGCGSDDPDSAPVRTTRYVRENGRVRSFAVRGLTRRHRTGDTVVVANDRIDLDIPAGEVFGILGPNGAGKTTLVRQLMGLLRPDEGGIELFGHDVVARPDLPARLVAYLGQSDLALAELPVATAVETTG